MPDNEKRFCWEARRTACGQDALEAFASGLLPPAAWCDLHLERHQCFERLCIETRHVSWASMQGYMGGCIALVVDCNI